MTRHKQEAKLKDGELIAGVGHGCVVLDAVKDSNQGNYGCADDTEAKRINIFEDLLNSSSASDHSDILCRKKAREYCTDWLVTHVGLAGCNDVISVKS